MKLTDYTTGETMEIDSDCVIEMHNRGAYREIKAGLNGLCEIKYKVTETVPQILDRIREDKRK